MATARESLLAEVLSLVLQPFDIQKEKKIVNIIDQYRIQVKPSQDLLEGKTARESLAQLILEIWSAGSSSNLEEKISFLIDGFRMQFKSKGGLTDNQSGGKKKKEGRQTSSDSLDEKEGPSKTQSLLNSQKQESSTPAEASIGGGPVKRKKPRGQCPKCHSMGVVLARSYSGDEYFSCVYCGFQSFRSGINAELDLPLAAELLQRKFDENDVEQEDND